MYTSEEYAKLREVREKIYGIIGWRERPALHFAIDLMLDTVDEEIEMVCLRFFAEGYTMGQQDAAQPPCPPLSLGTCNFHPNLVYYLYL